MTTSSCFSPGYVTGGHVLRLFHGHMDECLTISPADSDDQRRSGWGQEGLGAGDGGWEGAKVSWGVMREVGDLGGCSLNP